MEKKKQENKMRRDQLNDEYLELLDKQRLYFKTVKDFKEVSTPHCTLNTVWQCKSHTTRALIYHHSVEKVDEFLCIKFKIVAYTK